MNELLVDNAGVLRIGVFVTIFATMALWEIILERRHLRTSKKSRWLANILIIVADSIVVRLLFPLGAIGVAYFAAENGWGLFNLIEVPYWLVLIAAVIALDFVIWLCSPVQLAMPTLAMPVNNWLQARREPLTQRSLRWERSLLWDLSRQY